MRKRIFAICIFLGVLLGALVGRLVYIQLLGHEELSSAAKAQQLISLEGANTRGVIYDRNNTPLLGNNREYIFIMKADQFNEAAKGLLEAMNGVQINGNNENYRVYTVKKYDKDLGQKLIDQSDAYVIEAGRRYEDEQTAIHILGYVNPQDASGATGLELMCNDQLSLLQKKIYTAADVKGNIILGNGLVITTAGDRDSYVKKGIVTTLDVGIQGEIEKILKQSGYEGAVSILDSKTGDILAAASTPVFNPNKIQDYMTSTQNELVNKVTQGEYPPGSIFKTVVAAAALEKGISQETAFICKGHVTVNGNKVKCKTGGTTGHGAITMKEAFAQSCNSAFIQLGQKVGAEAIVEMAGKMGFGKNVLSGYPGEKPGNIMTVQQSAGAAIANLAIGQGETLATPIQVARMTNIIAAGGIDRGVHILQEESRSEEEVLSEETAMKLQAMMEETMVSGSGKELMAPVSMAGKTGSAESTSNNTGAVHGWFTGYAPAEEPEYAITVFMEDGRSGSGSAGPIFEKIVNYLNESGNFEREVVF